MVMRATYVGPDFLNGIPARDLSEDEYRALTNEQREDVRASGFYEVLTDREYADATREEKRGERATPTRVAPVEETKVETEQPKGGQP